MYIDHRYEVLESLGSGSWANVFKVRDIRTGNIYTLKLFQYLSSDELYKHFKPKDMHHITKIEHPNLNQVVDFGHVGDHIYFISDFFAGKTLNHFRFSKLKVHSLYKIIVQICYALNALHTQNIMHKDIKPENVLYQKSGNTLEVKLIDYGFSRMELDKDSQNVSGTLPYIAPEIYLGKSVGFSSDFYSLGVMIYRLTTGSFPFNLEQINALRSGSQQYFIPIFPSELNPDIPLHLEKLCLRLLERNPDNRFQSSEEIIEYINRTSGREYPFSVSWSLVNSMQFNSYTVRESIATEILDYLPQVEAGNGKVISLLGGEGLGKDNILSLFRYHVLRGSYFIFDYTCTRTDHEAFFALIKEYVQSLTEEEIKQNKSLKKISEKFHSYLFKSEQEAKQVTQTQKDLRADFQYARTLLEELSRQKPVIFIIRNIQHVHRYTIDFINFISEFVVKNRILVVMSCTDFNKINQINHTILINVPMFQPGETRSYIRRLLNDDVPESLCQEVHDRSSGNPYFVKEILIDLTLRNKIHYDGTLRYPEDLSDYTLPSRLLHSIYSRMSHLTDTNYRQLQKLAVVHTPISRDLIRYICKVNDQDLYNLLNGSKHNEILEKKGKHFYFTFAEAKQRFFDECSPKQQKLVSLRVLKYYQTRQVTDPETCRGIIENARIAGDAACERQYLLKLHDMLIEDHLQEEAYDTITEVIRIDCQRKIELTDEDIAADLKKLLRCIHNTGNLEFAGFIRKNQNKLPDIFIRHYVQGTFKLLAGSSKSALKDLIRAEELAKTPEEQAQSLLAQGHAYGRKDPQKMRECLEKLSQIELPLNMKIEYTGLKAKFQELDQNHDQATNTIEEFLAQLPPHEDPDLMIKLARLHNDLGELYSHQKNVSEADEHFKIALNIWKRYNIKWHLAWLHNNISDLYLKQGLTVTAARHSALALEYSMDKGLTLSQARALLNQGEGKIKMGQFREAEKKILEARELIDKTTNKHYLDSIYRNLALAKSKIMGFGHYYKFITQQEPKLIEGRITQINPLVKTYFYYLSEMSYPKKLRRLIQKNAHIDYAQINEQEFFHNVQSLLAISEKNYEKALQELKSAMQFAGEINNHYALAIFNVLQIHCHYGLREYDRARELIELALPAIRENQYRYWDQDLQITTLKLDLMDPSITLRDILRRVNHQLISCRGSEYYQLTVELMQIKIQILLELKEFDKAAAEHETYKAFLEQITTDINEEDRQNFLDVNQYNLKNIKRFNLIPIMSRGKANLTKWDDLLFNIANVNSIQRVKFLIEKGITQMISPWQIRLMVYSDKINNFYNFLCYNCDPEMFLPPEFSEHIERAFETDNLVPFTHDETNNLIVPLQSGSKRIGYLLLNDDGELPFTKNELGVIRNIRNHLTALIIRTWDYMDITLRMEKMNQLMHISHDLMRILDTSALENEIVSSVIDFTNATRGFMIKKDSEGNNLYQVQMDENKQFLTSAAGISNTALSLCQGNLENVITFNAALDKRFKNSVSVQDYAIQTIFCCPIMVDDEVFGFLYLDNYGETSREMYLNEDIITLLLKQVAIAIKNSGQYSSLIQKSEELNAFEQVKDEFMAIVSHELYTPLTTLQGHVSRLKRNLYADEEERGQIMQKLEQSITKLSMSVNDITTMNHYNVIKSITKSPIDITEILNLVYQEVQIISRQRKMQIKVETEKELPPVAGNWEALHRMIYNIVLNAVRFTREFGTIVIGARRSAFPQEKIKNKESLVLYVQDNGMGIPKKRIKDVFRKFYELNEIYAHKSGTVEYRSSGLGLGLAISRRIAELHGGEIVIKSKENEGTSVFMIIPFK